MYLQTLLKRTFCINDKVCYILYCISVFIKHICTVICTEIQILCIWYLWYVKYKVYLAFADRITGMASWQCHAVCFVYLVPPSPRSIFSIAIIVGLSFLLLFLFVFMFVYISYRPDGAGRPILDFSSFYWKSFLPTMCSHRFFIKMHIVCTYKLSIKM